MAPTSGLSTGDSDSDGSISSSSNTVHLLLRRLTDSLAPDHNSKNNGAFLGSLRNLHRATSGVDTVPEGYGLPNSPPPGTVAGIVVGSVAAFLFVLWVIYFCLNFGLPGRQVWSERGSVTNMSRSVVSTRRRDERSRSRATGTVITNAGPAAAAAAVIAVEGARRSRSRGGVLKMKKKQHRHHHSRSRSRSPPRMVEVRRETSTRRVAETSTRRVAENRRSGGGGGGGGGGRGGRYAYHNPNEDQIIVEEEMTDRSALGYGGASSVRSRSRSRGPMPPRGVPVVMAPGVRGGGGAGPGRGGAGAPPRVVPSSILSSEDYSHSETESEDEDEIVVMEENSTPPRSRRGGRRDRRG
ncbi:uncharacterized protein B0I36DRAFT_115239 [Microdochium trichocladiopsis]|uniref:Uncharacterized protein n=1 Tax=Microdochium trichocladiopsis TaxID=1682393 RepID=A0A9P8Y653_9PEZI|nr:uncharacterized protein B0I36DRAFT_115239 [Microdochium trichocladiopsis]KAH7030880.1 hypothetical protein B0I36DRAFT_115239 [Microdochium trichocladiopsis]